MGMTNTYLRAGAVTFAALAIATTGLAATTAHATDTYINAATHLETAATQLPAPNDYRNSDDGKTATRIPIHWTPVPGAVGYEIRWQPVDADNNPIGEWASDTTDNAPGEDGEVYHYITDLTPDTAYAVQIRSLGDGGEHTSSEWGYRYYTRTLS